MQHLRRAVVAALLFSAPAEAARASSRSEVVATAWLKDHPAPQTDELAELRGANPEAYAIVKALLTKRSLGLLDPKHPSASFTAPPAQSADVPSGPEAFQALAATGTNLAASAASAADVPEVPMAAPVHHGDWLNWKPKDSAADDETMVNNVLGAVAELKGGSARPQKSLLASRSTQEEAPQQPAASSDVDSLTMAAPVAPVHVQELSAPAVPAASDNSYLSSAGLGVPATPVQSLQENPYLQSADLGPATPKPKANLRQDSTDYLAGFSWDDEQPKEKKPVAAAAPEATQAKPDHKDALLSWLGGGSKEAPAAKPVQALAEQQAQPAAQFASGSIEEKPEAANPYLDYLH